MSEWKHNKRWNPFNSYKLLAHIEYWKKINKGNKTPAPILITVDPSNICNLNCKWCNSEYIRTKNHATMSKELLIKIADYLPVWCNSTQGVQAVCIAGGGEPLTNSHIGSFIDRLIKNKIEVGIVTNGILIDKFIEPLSKCVWVGVSVDAGTSQTYNLYKGHSQFEKVIENIRTLVKYSKENKTTLGSDNPAYGVSYKYLLYKSNIHEMAIAAKIAKDIGCKNIHFRPAGTPWDKLNNQTILFRDKDIQAFDNQINQCMNFDDNTFNVYGITHKFSPQFKKSNNFKKCYAIFMTAVFEPGLNCDTFNLGLCCDRRGDEKLELLKNCSNPSEISNVWGGHDHWKIHESICVSECPRCTYQPHNEIYENVILQDGMTYKFI